MTTNLFVLGERADFVLRADQPISSYYMRVVPADGCEKVTEASAIIKYDGAENIVPVVVPKDLKESNTRTPEHTEVRTDIKYFYFNDFLFFCNF